MNTFLQHDYWHRWFVAPGVFFAAQVPLLVLIVTGIFFWSLRRRTHGMPFFMVLALFFLTFVGLGISIFPYLVPLEITIWDAAAPETSLVFMLKGTAIVFPIIIAYTIWAHWVFPGKVAAQGYHE